MINAMVGSGRRVHCIEDGWPLCGKGIKRNGELGALRPTEARVNCSGCIASAMARDERARPDPYPYPYQGPPIEVAYEDGEARGRLSDVGVLARCEYSVDQAGHRMTYRPADVMAAIRVLAGLRVIGVKAA